ncbi:outer membrane protein [Mesorhizobium sp. dw_380]|uniref:outer membrane protein n=1 Tax=Mesorhizobium sp. dw_380 TaxID=2812001 RepID=UPI001BDF2E1B|nr:outer membrane protein [Mesorhizobium sp. dw_380]
MKTILLATALILAPAGMACAADINDASPAAYDWSGLYAGVHFGYVAAKSDLTVFNYGGGSADVVTSMDADGFIGGIHIGFDQEMASRFVLGAEADLAYNNVEGLTIFAGGVTMLKSELKWSGSARLRAGYAFDRTLPYITGGVAAAKYEVTGTTGTDSVQLHDETHTGWTLGAGVEHAFTDKWIARVEYRYSDFGTQQLSAADGINTAADVDLKTHDVRVGLSYKF